MIRTLLASRSTFYHLPGLEGEVSGHSGNRISQKVIQQCQKMARDAGLPISVVKDEIKRKADSPAKAKVQSGEGKAKKKRKVKDEDLATSSK